MKKILVFFAALILSLSTANAQQLYLTIDTALMRIGEQVKINLSAKVDISKQGKKLKWPSVPDSLAEGKVLVVERLPMDSLPLDKDEPNVFLLRQQIILTSFDSGSYDIGPFYMITNELDTVESNSISFEVKTLAIDTTKAIKDIKDIEEVPYTLLDWLKDYGIYVWSALLAAALIMVAIRWYLKKRRSRPIISPSVEAPVVLPHELALASLAEIKQKKPWLVLDAKQYYTHLTNVLRVYLEQRYELKAMEQTSVEILLSLRFTNCPDGAKQRLRELLTTADLAKFAKEKPDEYTSEQSVELALQFVELTQQVPQQDAQELK